MFYLNNNVKIIKLPVLKHINNFLKYLNCYKFDGHQFSMTLIYKLLEIDVIAFKKSTKNIVLVRSVKSNYDKKIYDYIVDTNNYKDFNRSFLNYV